MTGFRSSAARDLAKAVRNAGGQIERTGVGKLKVTGPDGVVTIHEPSGATRRDLQRSSAWRLITERTGLELAD